MSVVTDPQLHLLHLPDEALLHVLSFLNYRDLARVSQVCQRCKVLTLDDSLWKWQCQYYYLVNSCTGATWKHLFKKMHKEYGRYIQHYHDIRKAWTKIETFLEKHSPSILESLRAGITEEEIDQASGSHTLPLDVRLSYRIHDGQELFTVPQGLIGGGLISTHGRTDRLLPMASDDEDFSYLAWLRCGLIPLSFCPRTGCGLFIPINEMSGLSSVGSVYITGTGLEELNPTDGAVLKCYCVAPSFKDWFCKHADNLESGRYFIHQGYIFRFYQEPSCVATTSGVTVKATTCFMPELCGQNYFFAYRIIMSMDSDALSHLSCQLESRHWVITDGNGKEEEVDGPGVVGEYPIMRPGAEHAWISCCTFNTPSGNMRGFFRMRNLLTGAMTEVECPCYHMEAPTLEIAHLRQPTIECV